MSKNNRVTVDKSFITRASRILECRIRDALTEHFRCPCEFYWATSAFPVLKGKEGGISIDIYDQTPCRNVTASVTLNLQGELKLVISSTERKVSKLKSVEVTTTTTIRLQ